VCIAFEQSLNFAHLTELIQKCIEENARIALDQTEYQERYNGLVKRVSM
jgi:hypothetical protein